MEAAKETKFGTREA